MDKSKPRLVVAAVIGDGQGRYLLARRLPSAHLGGLWEFPGGGIEDGESPIEALVRELREELGVEVEVGRPLTFAWHRDEVKAILLLFYEAKLKAGEPQGREGQAIGWFTPQEMGHLPVPPADQELIKLLREK